MGGKSVYSHEKWLANKHRWKGHCPEERAKNRYGITPEQKKSMLETQENKCAICRRPFLERPEGAKSKAKNINGPHIDHNHLTGKTRGLLCHWCNTGLGCFGDNKECLIAAISYLKITEE